MTTVLRTDNATYDSLMRLSTEALTNVWARIGQFRYRNSTGANRSAGSYPSRYRVPVYYITKPYFIKGKRVRDGETKTRYRWVYKRPERASFEEEHSYTATHIWHSCSAGLALKRSGIWYYNGTPTNWDLNSVPDPYTSNDDIALLGRLREAVAASSFNAGVAIAESSKTFKMIGDTATKIFKAYKAVKRGNPVQAIRFLTGYNPSSRQRSRLKTGPEAVAGNWLEIQYGWKPLLKDIYEGSVYLDHMLKRPAVTRVAVTQSANGRKSTTYQMPISGTTYATLPIQIESSTRIVAKITAINNASLSGLMDPASVAWELTPFSFVLDWFIPIGNYLEAQSLSRSITGVYVTTHRFKWRKLRGVRAQSVYPLSTYHDATTMSIERMYLVRRTSTTLSVPLPSVKPFAKVATLSHALNAVALLVAARH